jgi:hypothetical protein
MPAAHGEIGLLGRQLNGSHLDDNLEPAVLEFLANALLADVVDFFPTVGFREHWITNLFPFEISHIVGLIVSFFVSTSLLRATLTFLVSYPVLWPLFAPLAVFVSPIVYSVFFNLLPVGFGKLIILLRLHFGIVWLPQCFIFVTIQRKERKLTFRTKSLSLGTLTRRCQAQRSAIVAARLGGGYLV